MSFNNYNYSYLNTAVDGYCYDTLTYDRLGIGNSSHGEPRNEIQIYLEVAALAELTKMLRSGSVPSIKKTYEKVVHVGHSFGSMKSYFLTALYPNLSDGLVLTGFGGNSSFFMYYGIGADLQQAYLNQPYRFGNAETATAMNTTFGCANLSGAGGDDNANINSNVFGLTDYFVPPEDDGPMYDYPPGYMITKDASTLQFNFLYPTYFDPDIAFYGEARKQPVTMGEILTLGALPRSTSFAGPVLVFTGSNDVIFCGGDCFATGGALPNVPASAKNLFPNASSFESYIQPNTGHGCVFHYNATAGYEYMNDWLAAQGLGMGA
jgi:pimeloyl-ACP methyl ester carboxylesterase